MFLLLVFLNRNGKRSGACRGSVSQLTAASHEKKHSFTQEVSNEDHSYI